MVVGVPYSPLASLEVAVAYAASGVGVRHTVGLHGGVCVRW